MTSSKKPHWKLFNELDYSDINVELHLHTKWTDGEASVEDIMSRSISAGLRQIAFTEHVRRDTAWYSDFASEVRRVASQYPGIDVYVGCEAKVLDTAGRFDANESTLAQCDIVLGSVHRFPDDSGGFLDFSSLPANRFAEIEFELACGLLERAPIDVLAHPGGMFFRRFGIDFPEPLMRELMRQSLGCGVAIEINSAYLNDIDSYLHLCAGINPIVSVGSDMHRLANLGHCRDLILKRGFGVQ